MIQHISKKYFPFISASISRFLKNVNRHVVINTATPIYATIFVNSWGLCIDRVYVCTQIEKGNIVQQGAATNLYVVNGFVSI